ncbi:MAG: ATP-binding protein [Kiritimatiellae bacterium]|nr:ATP-binding protein [Kiritimatiellia bacterium]
MTACMLLGLLAAFYLGGRFILVHMLRQAEQNIQVIGADIRNLVYGEMVSVQRSAHRTAESLPQSLADVSDEFMRDQILRVFADTPVTLAVVLNADGTFLKGIFLASNGAPRPVESHEINQYFSENSPLSSAISEHLPASGLIIFNGKPMFFALSPHNNQQSQLDGFIVLGAPFHNASLISRINTITHGMHVAVTDRAQRNTAEPQRENHEGQPLRRPAPIFKESINYYAGGRWHLGENTFEAVMPVNDIMGKEVSAISIRMPGSFSSLASIALGWLTSFTAAVGIIFVLPMFWLQSRVLLNPLSTLTGQIREIGKKHLDGNCAKLVWPRNDEFGMLAESVNEMIAALADNTSKILAHEQKQRALIAGMPDCLCLFDRNANVITVHKQPDYAHPIPGLLTGRPISPPIFPDTDCEAMSKAIEDAFQSNDIQMVMLCCRESDGSYRHFETRISRLDDAVSLVVMRDMTKEWRERETREQMETRLSKVDKMESLSTLAAGIAHDVNNILTIIQNTIDITWENPDEGSEQEAVSTIRQATGKGVTLTRELMTYAGHTSITFKHEDPNKVIIDLEKLMGGVIASNVSLELKLTPGLPMVDVDPHQFWKVIINLLKNASEAMGGASGHIRISTYPFILNSANANDFFSTQTLNLGRGIVFQVDDTGSGIPQDVIKRMFEPFFSTKSVGRGLGLATVFGIVDAHNGGIAISSKLGKGTTFRVWLPVAIEQPPALSEPTLSGNNESDDSSAAEASFSGSGPLMQPCVLLIEDDRSIIQATTILLRSFNVEVFAATSKREAISLFRKHADAVSVILLDAQIGELDNVRLLGVLRLRKPTLKTIIISGYNEDRISRMFATESYDCFLKKPYTRGELKTTLEKFIRL